ncbi:hypothetical protein LEP3755_66320 (plasmid) [Leptolyngbya sp. NIES-3755]|nr:hypothetical protein LEP3755_66320 [Leptolyngbya sp. NIES-3755]
MLMKEMEFLFKRKRLPKLVCLSVLLIGLASCQSRISKEQIASQRQEAIAQNKKLLQKQSKDLTKNWKLTIQGQIPEPITLNWSQIEALATHELNTAAPFPDKTQVAAYRGVSVEQLLKQAGVNVEAPENSQIEITSVAADDYYTIATLQQVREQNAMLAITENGQPMRRNDGGPLQLIFDLSSKVKTENGTWVYYVTHLIVGNEPLRLQIGSKTLNLAALERLPKHRFTRIVGYKHNWSSEPVQLTGVKLKDLLRSQKIKLSAQTAIRIRRKAMDKNNLQKSTLLSAELINNCDVMLAYRWGASQQAITTKKGGPLTLAYGKNCDSQFDRNLEWLPFVESISVEVVKR